MHFLKLRISGENMDIEGLNKLFQLNPDFAYKKGDIKDYRGKRIVYQEDCWMKEMEIASDGDIEQAVESFLDMFIKSKEEINNLTRQFDVMLWLDLYPDTTQLNLHISKDIIKCIEALGIDFNVSIMCLQPFYDGTYKEREKIQ